MRVCWIGGIRLGAGGDKIWAFGISPVHDMYTARDVVCDASYMGREQMNTRERRGRGERAMLRLFMWTVSCSAHCRIYKNVFGQTNVRRSTGPQVRVLAACPRRRRAKPLRIELVRSAISKIKPNLESFFCARLRSA